jgi:uncharacterized repeat protein (TIGR03803 family)
LVLSSGAHGAVSGPVSKERVLYNFRGTPAGDGENPYGALLPGPDGTLYGTTTQGGTVTAQCPYGCGTVFALTPSGSGYSETVLYRFQGGSDGWYPESALIADTAGALYGTTTLGGTNDKGTVFKNTAAGSGYSESVLHVFGAGDGALPEAGLLLSANGALFGTTMQGGANGKGIAYELMPSGSGYAYTIVYAFGSYPGDGTAPYAPLIADQTGALYSTTEFGGSAGFGSVFKLTPARSGYAESLLYSFQGGRDGAGPFGGLLADSEGSLFGTTPNGGAHGQGTVYALTPSRSGYRENVLHSFRIGIDATNPEATLVTSGGSIYGTTPGINRGRGAIFSLTPVGGKFVEREVYRFPDGGRRGANPVGGLIADAQGNLYGPAVFGGSKGFGAIYEFSP